MAVFNQAKATFCNNGRMARYVIVIQEDTFHDTFSDFAQFGNQISTISTRIEHFYRKFIKITRLHPKT